MMLQRMQQMKKKVKITFDGKTKEVTMKVRGVALPSVKVIPDKKSKEKQHRIKKVTYDGE